jgi:subtilisin family serine protease
MTPGSGLGPGSVGLVSLALAMAFLSSVASISPGASWRDTSASRLASLPRNSLATGPLLASGPAAASSVRTVYPSSTRFSPQGPYLDGSVMIGFHSGVSAAQRHAIEQAAGALAGWRLGPVIKPVGHGRVTGAEYLSPFELRVPDGQVLSVVDRLRHDRGVAYAAPNYLSRASATEPPSDPFFSKQWGDQNTGQLIPNELGAEEAAGTPGADDRATAAWSVTPGNREIVIGEVDTGVAYKHPDLKANVWSNPLGLGENGKGGKCAAGTHGFDEVTQTCEPLDEDTTYGGHGSHVAGIMGGAGNNGVVGMNWETTILPVRWVKNANDAHPTSVLIKALLWLVKAKQEGVNIRVVNDSDVFEGTVPAPELQTAIELLGANGILFVTAAGNTSKNNDEEGVKRYPCKYDLPTEICVTASTNKDALAGFANYGPKTVDLAAPGQSIYSTFRENNYGYLSGGSMASPQVAGAAALILSAQTLHHESLFTPEQLKTDIVNNVDKVPALEGKVISGGRLDVCKAMPGCPLGSQPIVATNAASSITQTSATLNATVNPNGATVEDCHFEYGPSPSYGSSVPCVTLPGAGTSPVAVSASVEGLSENTTYHVRIVATNSGGTSHGEDQEFITAPQPPPTVTTDAASSIEQTSATLNGTVNPDGAAVSDCHFEYGTTLSYGSSLPCAPLPGSGNGAVAVSATALSLSPGASNYYRIDATNAGGTSYGAAQAFTTPPAAPPLVPQAPGGPWPSPGQGVLSTQEHNPQPVATVELASTALVVTASGAVGVEVICPAGEASCAGTLTIWRLNTFSVSASPHQPKKRKTAVLILARGSFTVLGGRVRTVKLRLSAKARSLLAHTNVLHARATLVARDPIGTVHTTHLAVTLSVPSAIRHSGALGTAQPTPAPR